MKNTDDEPRRLSFKDFTVVDYVPGEGQYINYQAQKRHRGTVGEEVEQVDEATSNYLSKDQLPAKVQRVVTNIFKLAKKEKKRIQRVSVEEVNKKYNIYVELGRDNNDENFVGKMMGMETGREKFVAIHPSESVHPAPSVSVKESVEHLDEKVRPLEMTQAKYDSYPKNKKGKSGGKLYIIQNQKSGVTKGGVKFTSLGGGAGTTKVPVKIVKELPYKYEESVEQTDEMSNKLLNRYSDAAKKDTKKDRTKGMRKARNIRTQRANKGLFGSDIGEEVEQVDELSKATSISYLKKANKDQNSRSDTLSNKSMNREVGMSRAAKNVNKKGGLSTVDKLRHRTRGFIGVNKESVEHLDELTQREKDMIADRKAKRDTKAGRKDKNTRLLPKTTTYVGTSKEDKQSIVMQLRRAQDSANFGNGSFGIRVSPVKDAATVNLKKPQIDKLLAVYDKLEKPEQKRKYRITLLKTLRSMQQKGK